MNGDAFAAPWLLTAAEAFARAGKPLYAVGGAVRNALMGLPAYDVDVCGPATPEEVARLCEGTPVRAVLRAAHFGTVELHVADQTGRYMAEYTTFRVDSYRGGHQPSAVRFADSPDVDALRRDFSVNALYRQLFADPYEPTPLIDPTGGLAHLRQKVLHTVTADPDQVLKDDGLRILRAARFQAELGLTPTPALLASAARFAPLLREIALERLRDELTRLLMSDVRYPSLSRTENPVQAGLTTLMAVGAWEPLFGALLPDRAGIAAQPHYTPPEGVPPVMGRLSLLFWREAPQALADRLLALRFSLKDVAFATDAHQALRGAPYDRLTRMDVVRLGLPALRQAAAALDALEKAGEPLSPAAIRAREMADVLASGIPLSLRALAVTGHDLLLLSREWGLPPHVIGETLEALLRAAVEGKVANTRPALIAEAQRLMAETAKCLPPGNTGHSA